MESRFHPARKEYPEKGYKVLRPVRPEEPKVPIRTALLVLLAAHLALADAGLLYMAHTAGPLIIISAAIAFCGGYHFFDDVVEEDRR